MLNQEYKEEILMLGTGSAFPEHSYNSCFVMRAGTLECMTDAGGGNGVLGRLRQSGVSLDRLDHLMVTHAHTDHILGVVWVVRGIINLFNAGDRDRPFNIYGNASTVTALDTICRLTLLRSHYEMFRQCVRLHEVSDGQSLTVAGTEIRFIDCMSENVSQTGFVATLPSGTTVACLGDESLTERNAGRVAGVDWLLCGAFCRYADREEFRPYEKHHFTVRDVALQAARADIGNLVLIHCEDRNLSGRKELYSAEAREYFRGGVCVPVDGETIELYG